MKKVILAMGLVVVANALLANQPTDSLSRKIENLEKKVAKQQAELNEIKTKSNATKKATNNSTFVVDRRGSKQWYKKPA